MGSICGGKPKGPGGKDPRPLPTPNPDKGKLDAKIVLIGNSGVGKTSIAMRYKEGKFNDNPKATVGAAYFQKTVPFKDGSVLRLHIWDTGGQEKFQSIAPLYYRVILFSNNSICRVHMQH